MLDYLFLLALIKLGEVACMNHAITTFEKSYISSLKYIRKFVLQNLDISYSNQTINFLALDL
jgi:intergrase/recombinase